MFSIGASAAGLPAGHPNAPKAAAYQPRALPWFTQQGNILSVINVPHYSYVEVNEDGKTIWLATMTVEAGKGDLILFDKGAAMSDFYSSTLKRKFPEVMFVSRAAVYHKQP